MKTSTDPTFQNNVKMMGYFIKEAKQLEIKQQDNSKTKKQISARDSWVHTPHHCLQNEHVT